MSRDIYSVLIRNQLPVEGKFKKVKITFQVVNSSKAHNARALLRFDHLLMSQVHILLHGLVC